MPNWDLVNVFNATNIPNQGMDLTKEDVQKGATKLDCIGKDLKNIYERTGFEVVKVEPWDDQFAPPDWNYKKYGRPNIYFMEYKGGTHGRKGIGTEGSMAESGGVPGATRGQMASRPNEPVQHRLFQGVHHQDTVGERTGILQDTSKGAASELGSSPGRAGGIEKLPFEGLQPGTHEWMKVWRAPELQKHMPGDAKKGN